MERNQNPETAMADACGPELEAFLGCRCHVSRQQAAGQCSKLMCQDLEENIRKCSQRNLQSVLLEVEKGCEPQLDAFVRCIVASKGSVTDECKVVRGILSECATRVLGARATMFTSALSRPEGLVTYRLASGKTVIE